MNISIYLGLEGLFGESRGLLRGRMFARRIVSPKVSSKLKVFLTLDGLAYFAAERGLECILNSKLHKDYEEL